MNHVFVDESKARDYLLAATSLDSVGLHRARRVVKGLTLPGQSRIHMKKESDTRRRQILSALAPLAMTTTIYRADRTYRTELARREQCLRALVADIARSGPAQLCLERDESLVSRDRQHLIEATRSAGCVEELHYRHESATSEPMLAIPDALAWAWAKGGDWRRRAAPMVGHVIAV